MTSTWTNWAGDQSCAPARHVVPANQAEVAALVTCAAKAGLTVRVAGSGHSFTDAVLTDGTLISLERMNRVLDVDLASGLVRAEAGATLNELSIAMHRHGLAFANLGDVDVQSIAGATATGTHGTGARLMNLSAALHSIELTLADGSTLEVSEASDPDAWRAARVSVGALGIVTAVTVQAVPSFVLDAIDRPRPMDGMLADIDSLVDGNDHFEFFTFPHSPLALTKTSNRTDRAEKPRPVVTEWIHKVVAENYIFGTAARLGRARPSLIPTINRTASRANGRTRRIDRSFRVFATPRHVRFTEMEYAIPRAHAVDAIRRIKTISERSDFDTPFPIEIRWAAPDDAFLSPAGGRETCYVAVHMYQGMEWEPYFHACEEVFDSYDGRPHWGKRHFKTAETLRPHYPEWDRFAAVRKRLDPEGLFANAYVDRVLGPVSAR